MTAALAPSVLAEVLRGATVRAAQLRWVQVYVENRHGDATATLARHGAVSLCACGQCRESRAVVVVCRELMARLPAPAVSTERRAASGEGVTA